MRSPAHRPDWTGHQFTNGSSVLRCEGRVRIGTRMLPQWVIRCVCGETYTRSSQVVARAARGGHQSFCEACEARERSRRMIAVVERQRAGRADRRAA